jgi:hypothetical protein
MEVALSARKCHVSHEIFSCPLVSLIVKQALVTQFHCRITSLQSTAL